MILISFFIVLLFSVPVYYMCHLRHGIDHFVIFFFALYLSTIANFYLGHITAAITRDSMVQVLLFPGTTLTLQVSLYAI